MELIAERGLPVTKPVTPVPTPTAASVGKRETGNGKR